MSSSNSRHSPTGIIRLAQDISKLLNNPQGSDVQFKIGCGAKDVTVHAHSAILYCRSRYFAALLETNNEWKERSGWGWVIHKPNMSPLIFHKILEYIYTGDVQVKTDDLYELLSAAEETELDELSIECQTNIVAALKYAFSNGEESANSEKKDDYQKIQSPKLQRLPINVAVHKLLIPALTLTKSRNMLDFSHQILTLTTKHIGVIFASLGTRILFFDKIPIPIFQQILASDALEMQEFNAWELAFSLACHKTKVSRSAVETHFRVEGNTDYDNAEYRLRVMSEDSSSEPQELVSEQQLKQLKKNLLPLLPGIRFSLMNDDEYSRIVEILSFFLPARRSIELQQYHAQSEKTRILDLPRLKRRHELPLITINPEDDLNPLSNVIEKTELWQQVKTWIFESKGIKGFRSARDIKFSLLFRASEHKFSAYAFHKHCDNKGPTIVIVKSEDGHLFGGANFEHWKPGHAFSGTGSDFLFALVDGRHRKTAAKFSYHNKDGLLYAAINSPSCGPAFGNLPFDLAIHDKANISISTSNMPQSYFGVGASCNALAGSQEFLIAEYEVFSILKR